MNKLQQDIMNFLETDTLQEAMEEFSGRDVYETTRPYTKLTGFKIRKGTLYSISLNQWRGKETKLNIGLQNIKEGSASQNNTEFNQYFWTLDEAVEQMREWFDAEQPDDFGESQ